MRNVFFDILKGYAIFLVVFGHVMQNFYPNWEKNIIVLVIYSFHMPLFIAISGNFLIRSVEKKGIRLFITNRFFQLLLPSITIGIINAIIFGGSKYLKQDYFDWKFCFSLILNGLWFLNVLFVLSVVGCLIYKYLGKCMEIAWICFILLLYFCPGYWLINEIKYLAPFFMSGILFRKYNYEKIPLWILLSSFFIFTILLSKFNFSMTVYYMQDNIFSYSYFSLFLFRLVIGFTGCLSSILICKMLNKVFYLHKYFVIIGTNTLPIYVLHQKLFEWNKLVGIEITNIIIIFCLTIICIFISLGLYKIFIKNNLVSLLLFGNYIKTRSVE